MKTTKRAKQSKSKRTVSRRPKPETIPCDECGAPMSPTETRCEKCGAEYVVELDADEIRANPEQAGELAAHKWLTEHPEDAANAVTFWLRFEFDGDVIKQVAAEEKALSNLHAVQRRAYLRGVKRALDATSGCLTDDLMWNYPEEFIELIHEHMPSCAPTVEDLQIVRKQEIAAAKGKRKSSRHVKRPSKRPAKSSSKRAGR